MANYFQLFKKGSDLAEELNSVDEAICAHLGKQVHPEKYCCGWFDTIGYLIASGRPLGGDELRIKVNEWYEHSEEKLQVALKILTFLEENYTSTRWSAR